MKKDLINVSIEFGFQLSKYLAHFELIEADLARVFNTNSHYVKEILTGKKGTTLKTAEKYSNFFGTRYYELANPNFPMPNFESLPNTTKEAILHRKNIGTKIIERNYENDIAGNLDKIIDETDLLLKPSTAEELRLQFPENIRDKITTNRITNLLKKSGRNKIVIKVGKRGNAILFQLKEYALIAPCHSNAG